PGGAGTTKVEPEPEPEPEVSDKPEPDQIDPDQPDRSKLEPLTTGRTVRLMAEDAADQRSQSKRGQTRKKERGTDDLEPDPITDAPLPGNQSSAGQQQQKAAARAKKSNGFGRFVTYVVLLIILLAAAFGTMPWWYTRMPPMVQNWIPETLRPPAAQMPSTVVADITSLQQRLAATETEVEALRQALQSSTQSEGPNTQALATTLSALQQRLAAVEARPAQSGATGVPSTINGDAVTALGNAAANQAQQLALVTARIATVEAAANSLMNEQPGAIGLLLAASQLQDAISNGRPYALELEIVLAFAAKQERLSIDTKDLAVHQSAGVPTRAALRQQFDRFAPAVVRAGLLPSDTASWLQRTLDSLFAVIVFRRLDDDGSAAVGAVVNRIERALDIGDLEAAIAAAESLGGLASEALSPWLAKAQATASVERAVTTLSTQAIAQMNAGRDFEPATSETDD
ncbi:MAG: mitofilin family membrane protein, partial [Rhodospirillaceae bacterium]